MMIDTHTHIYGPEFDSDRPDVVERALQAGVRIAVLPNVNEESLEQIKRMCRQYPDFCLPAIGLHPEDVGQDYASQLQWVRRELETRTYVAVGEIGVDLYWDKTFQNEQIAAFQQQVEWAVEFDLPLIIHTRNSHQETLDALSAFSSCSLRGVFHCFTGNEEQANEILNLGDFMLGIGGVLTFKNSPLPDFLHAIPVERIVLETDAPYLTPVPFRGKRNEPAHLKWVVKRLSEIYKMTEEEIQRVTTENACQLFQIPPFSK